ncbi:hypothetical protein [Motilimonas eburnea]|uniref:hypothetical protein n=1 Tax=Motilimonas eburnea TaxID=1737488 RepID=UPI001E4CFABB|nr:hypothetical protein [Motilimonas eburnea]MCE2572140.1 hypothetical protein [Motilimonas eburnea]
MIYCVLDKAVLELKLSHSALRTALLQDYLTHANSDLALLRAAFEQQDELRLKQLLITLQGTASLVCAKPLELALKAFKQEPNQAHWQQVAKLQAALIHEVEHYLSE